MVRMLADPVRARIVELLADGALCTCHLVEELDAKQPLVSHHLRALRDAGVVVREPHGRFTYYRLVPEVIEAAAAKLTQVADRARASAEVRRECP